jgi:hypothetical protein
MGQTKATALGFASTLAFDPSTVKTSICENQGMKYLLSCYYIENTPLDYSMLSLIIPSVLTKRTLSYYLTLSRYMIYPWYIDLPRSTKHFKTSRKREKLKTTKNPFRKNRPPLIPSQLPYPSLHHLPYTRARTPPSPREHSST